MRFIDIIRTPRKTDSIENQVFLMIIKKRIMIILLFAIMLTGCTKQMPSETSYPETDATNAAYDVTQFSTEPTEASLQNQNTIFKGKTWQEAYRNLLRNDPDTYIYRIYQDPMSAYARPYYGENQWEIYLGIHDFNQDDVPELIVGDYDCLTVYSFSQGETKIWGVVDFIDRDFSPGGVVLNNNALCAAYDGAGGAIYAGFTVVNGKKQFARYIYYPPYQEEIEINGKAATREEVDALFAFRKEYRYEDYKKMVTIQNAENTWLLTYYGDDLRIEDGLFVRGYGTTITVDDCFDFSLFVW